MGATSSARKKGNGAFVVGLFLGGLVGAAVGVWKAAQSGAELRQRLLRSGSGARARVERLLTGERIEDAVAEGKAVAHQRQVELARRG